MFTKAIVPFLILSGISTFSYSALVMSSTRVIFPSNQKSVSIQVRNSGETPSLMQTWMDDGDANTTPDKSNVPFILSPPMSRIDPNVGQAINIRYLGANLPKDRESIFYLNILDIPAKPKDTAEAKVPENYLQFTFRSRLKVFYRPDGLKGYANDAPKAVTWSLNGNTLTANNPTPYFINIAAIRTAIDDPETNLITEGMLIEPFEHKRILIANPKSSTIYIKTVNDYGGNNDLKIIVNK